VAVDLGTVELDAALRDTRMTVLLGRPGTSRDEVFLRILGSALSDGQSLVLHSKPFVRAERLLQLLSNREELLSRVVFHYISTFESQEDALRRLDIDLAKIGSKSVFFDCPTDNYLVSLALAVNSPQGLKDVNMSLIRQFAYLKEVSAKSARVLVTMGDLSGINTVEEYLLRHWPDLIINMKKGGDRTVETGAYESTSLSHSNARVITLVDRNADNSPVS